MKIELQKFLNEYEKIKSYLIEYKNTDPQYSANLDNLHGISPFDSEVKNLLKDLKEEEDYIFFGKILIKISCLGLEKRGNKDNKIKVSDIINNSDYFIPIISEKEYEEFVKIKSIKMVKISAPKFTLEDICEKINIDLRKASSYEGGDVDKEDILNILAPYSPQESLDIILNLEKKIKPFFSKRNEEYCKCQNNAMFINEILGISKDLKGKLVKEIKEVRIFKGEKWEKNLDRLNLKNI